MKLSLIEFEIDLFLYLGLVLITNESIWLKLELEFKITDFWIKIDEFGNYNWIEVLLNLGILKFEIRIDEIEF